MAKRTEPTIAQLRAFVAVADVGQFTDAARLIGVAQPTLSQALTSLEENLGVQLIERRPRGILLTPAGEHILPYARRAVAAVEAVNDAAAPDRGWLTGVLRIGVIPTVAPYLLPSILKVLPKEAPDLIPEFREDQTPRLLNSLKEGRIELAILALPTKESGLVELPLYDEDFVLVVPSDDKVAGKGNVKLDVLVDRPLLLLDEGHCLRDQALDVCAMAGAQTPEAGTAKASSLPTIVQFVIGGLGSSLLPDTAIAVEANRPGLAIARFASPAPGRRLGLVFRETTARTEEFEDLAEIIRRGVQNAELAARPVGGLTASSS